VGAKETHCPEAIKAVITNVYGFMTSLSCGKTKGLNQKAKKAAISPSAVIFKSFIRF